MVGNHVIIHLSLVVALPLCYTMYDKYACKDQHQGNLLVTQFWWVHVYCTISAVLAYIFGKFEQYEWSKFWKISCVPVYLFYIF